MSIEDRVLKLERQNRMLWILVALIALMVPTALIRAADTSTKVVADSIETHSLAVLSPYGKQAINLEVGDSGMAVLTLTRPDGTLALGLSTTPSGDPGLCFDYAGKCRIVLGQVYRDSQRELSIQLRDKDGRSIWMPDTPNPEE